MDAFRLLGRCAAGGKPELAGTEKPVDQTSDSLLLPKEGKGSEETGGAGIVSGVDTAGNSDVGVNTGADPERMPVTGVDAIVEGVGVGEAPVESGEDAMERALIAWKTR